VTTTLQRPPRQRNIGRYLTVGVVLVIVAYLAAVPVLYLIGGTFTGDNGSFTLSGFTRAFSAESQAGRMMLNSIIYAVGSGAVALVIGTALAYVQVRTDAPAKALLFAASMVPLIIPGVLYAVSWIFLADKTVGLLNTLMLRPLGVPISVYGMPGMIAVEGLHSAPLAFLIMVGAFQGMDPSLEESAAMSGAKWWSVFRRVTLPLVRPALVAAGLLMFVRALSSFEIPTILGLQHGVYVFTSRIYHELRTYPIDYGAAGAYALALLAIAAAGVLLSNFLNRNARSYQTISGKAFRPRLVSLGKARYVVGTLVVLFFVVAVILPLLALIYASLLKFYQPFSLDVVKQMSLANYEHVLAQPTLLRAFRNSFVVALIAATAIMLLSSVAAWFTVRTKVRGRQIIDVLAFLPLVIPGLVLGLALLFLYLRVPLPIYGTLLILVIAFCTLALPFGMQYATAAMRQISNELEESAQVFGASWFTSFRRVLLPLASGGLVAGWIYIAIVTFRELSAAILVYSPGNEVASVLIWQQYENGSFMALAAMGVILVLVLTALVIVAQRLGARVGLQKSSS
jgi:iron(III) transport system permease protein